ncbi:hypothetical protein OG21DRAFT_1512431 [Imleria badia]|nr:hypothetical protein OG21DRAFT_1512431 [Imleria badia]
MRRLGSDNGNALPIVKEAYNDGLMAIPRRRPPRPPRSIASSLCATSTQTRTTPYSNRSLRKRSKTKAEPVRDTDTPAAGLDYVDFNGAMDTCRHRLASPDRS